MLKSDYMLSREDSRHDKSKVVTAKISAFLETRIVYFYSIVSYDMNQWDFVFVVQWLILALQIMRFLSDAYIPYEWNNSFGRVVMTVSDFVTEIPWVSQITAYYITVVFFAFVCLWALFCTTMHYYYQWTQPLRLMRQLLFWLNVIVLPEIIPHFKMIFPCFSYSASSYTMHPFYPDLVCWQDAHIGFFISSVFLAVGVMTLTYLNSMCFYNAEIPNELQVRNLKMNNKYSGNTETVVFTMKMIILALNLAGHSSNWRFAMGFLTFLLGGASTYHVVAAAPWWHDTTMTMYIFKGFIFTWTGFCALLMTGFEDSEGVGMLYFVMFPVLLLAANMLLRWRFMCVASIAPHELDSPMLAILKLRNVVRSLTLWLAQFSDIYLEMTPELQVELDTCGQFSANVIEVAITRFPESVELHILCAQYYMTVQANRVLAYRSLTLAEKAGGNLDNRFRCQAIRQELDMATSKDKSEEVKAYTEFKARKEVAENILSQAMKSLVQFWTEVMQATPDVDKLATIGERARHQLDVTIAHFERLLQLNRQSIPVLRLYGVLCLEVLGDVARAQELFAQADGVARNKRKAMFDSSYAHFVRVMDVELDIFDDANAVVSISLNPDTIGRVDNVNPAFLKMLGFINMQDIVGKNIKMIVPEPIRSYHDRYLLDYSRTRKSSVVDKVCLAMGTHQQGHLVPCGLYLRWADEAVGQMIATMQPFVNPHEVAFFVDVHTWNITYATANFVSVFGFSKRDVLAQRVKFLDVLPELKDDYGAGQINEEIYNKLLSSRGYEACGQHAITQQYFKLQCYLRPMAIYDTTLLFFRCEVSQMQKDDGDDAFMSDLDSEVSDTKAMDVLVSRAGSATRPHSSARAPGGSRTDIHREAQPTGAALSTTTGTSGSLPSTQARAEASVVDIVAHESSLTLSSRSRATAYTSPRTASSQPTSGRRLVPAQPSCTGDGTNLTLKVSTSSARNSDGDGVSLSVMHSYSDLISPLELPPGVLRDDEQHAIHTLHAAAIAGAPSSSLPSSPVPVTPLPASPDGTATPSFVDPALVEASLAESVAAHASTAAAHVILGPTVAEVVMGSGKNALVPATPVLPSSSEQGTHTYTHATDSHASAASSSLHGPPTTSSTLEVPHVVSSLSPAHQLPSPARKDTVAPLDNSALLRRRRNAAQKRLKAAIANDNIHTVRRLRWFTMLSSLVVAVGMALVLVDVLMSEADLNHTSNLLTNIAYSSQRQTYNVFTALNLYTFHLFNRNPNAADLPAMLNRDKYTFAESLESYHNTVQHFAELFYAVSLSVDASSTDSAKLQRLRDRDVIRTYMRNPNAPTLWDQDHMMSLKDAVTHCSAMVQWSLYEKKEKVEDDPGYFFSIANLVGSVIDDAIDFNTSYVLEEIKERGDYMFLVSIIIFVITSIAPAVIAALLLAPLLLHVERGKERVLNIFMAVPHSVRKALRHKAMRVYRLVEKVEESDHNLTTTHEDEDMQTNDETDGAMSVAGSEATSFSHLSGATANEDAYATIFRRYNNLRNVDKDFSSGEDNHDQYGNGKSQRVDAVMHEEKQRTHKDRTDRVDGVLLSNRGNTLSVAEGQSSGRRTGEASTGAAVVAADVDSMDALSVMSGGTDRPLAPRVGDRAIEENSGVKYNVWTGAAVIMTASRFSVFVVILMAYFATLLVLTRETQADVYNAAKYVAVGNNRNPRLGLVLLYTMEHLFHNRDEQKASHPLDPITFGSAGFSTMALSELAEAKSSMDGLLFGGFVGITTRIRDTEQDELAFRSACDIDPVKFDTLYSEAKNFPDLLPTCGDVMGGMLNHGLYTTFTHLYERMQEVLHPRYNKILSHILTGGPPQGNAILTASVKAEFTDLYELYRNYMFHFLRYSGLMYYARANKIIDDFNTIRYILVGICCAFLVLSLLVLVRPINVVLARTASQTNAMILLLPAQIARHVKEIQAYIDDNLSKD